ncbi:MAG: hypothetical protein JO056_06370 [Alphaproteobacteria bacterium]|uniref:hypothetical protein n=1 Tax=Bradyrhizobium sp. TaxID=376 RepID=UPI001EB753E4|nr:hypothetical protein [Bradyrhizobium sp.]MBV9570846.1 hypothetical protein [Alphaproteobacteria bacterium]MBV9979096.1 hypothetical protein [Bradyrhizobium sp.]
MGTRTVRLDEGTERILKELRTATGLTISEVLKLGVQAYAKKSKSAAPQHPYEIYRHIELGEGGWAIAPARNAKRAAGDVIRRKHRR